MLFFISFNGVGVFFGFGIEEDIFDDVKYIDFIYYFFWFF